MRLIDLKHIGLSRSIACWQVDDALIDCGPTSTVERLLSELGEWRPSVLLLTHIHLDHAGAAGALARRWPQLLVYVHERGAPHLAGPERLVASVSRLYGDQMDTLWGSVDAVPAPRLRPLRGGERVGAFVVECTPGHASHHVSFLHDSGRAFVGDATGVRLVPERLIVPHAPPPDIDLDAWERSLDLLRDWAPTSLALPHFGVVEDAAAHIEEMRARLRESAELAHRCSLEEFVLDAEERFRGIRDELRPVYRHTAPPEHSYAGLSRFWMKREDRSKPQAQAGVPPKVWHQTRRDNQSP